MVKIIERYRIECDYCDKVLQNDDIYLKLDYITINSNDFGYSETEQESHYCNKNCINAMIKTFENKYNENELNEISEYWELKKLSNN